MIDFKGSVRIYQYIRQNNTWTKFRHDLDGLVEEQIGNSVSLNNAGSIVAIAAPYASGGSGMWAIFFF